MSDFDGTFFSALSLDETFQTATANSNRYNTSTDDMDIDEYETPNDETPADFHTPEPDSAADGIADALGNADISTSTPFDWKVWANKDFASKSEVRRREKQRSGKRHENDDGDSTVEYDGDQSTVDYETAADSSYSISALSMSILSPTVLGAKFAIDKRQKLLMPPPPRSEDGEDSVAAVAKDEDMDDSGASDSALSRSISPAPKVRNISTFSSSSDPSLIFMPESIKKPASNGGAYDEPEEYIYNPASGDYDYNDGSSSSLDLTFRRNGPRRGSRAAAIGEALGSTSSASAAVGGSYQSSAYNNLRYPSMLNSPSAFQGVAGPGTAWSGHTPIQVHHHHYYSSPQSRDGGGSLAYKPTPTSRSAHFNEAATGLHFPINQYTPVVSSPSNSQHLRSHQRSFDQSLNSHRAPSSPGRPSVQEKLELIQRSGSGGGGGDYYGANSSALANTSRTAGANTSLALAQLPPPWQSNSTPHERIPYILSSYVQLVLNALLTSYASYLIYAMVKAIRRDISVKVSQQISNTLIEIASCERAYYENFCEPDQVVPAMELQCKEWFKCMNQDRLEGGGNASAISAEHFGIILNSLIEPLGLKFFCIMSGFIFVLFAFNFFFGYLRAKAYYGWDDGAARQPAGAGAGDLDSD